MTDAETVAQIDANWSQFLAEMAAKGTPVCPTCHQLLDGDTCKRSCQWVTPPEVLAAAVVAERFEYAAVDGEPIVEGYEPPPAREQEIVALYERIQAQVNADAKTVPNGCCWCGVERYRHGNRWTGKQKFHLWEPPTDGQRLGRMLARRHSGWQAWREINRRFYLRLPTVVVGEVR